MKNYTPPEGEDSPRKGGKSKKTAKKKKDPNAPKRNLSVYMIFSNKMRPILKAEKPELSFGDLAKEISEKFRKLTDEDKKEYEDLASKDKERYAKEMAAYKAQEAEKTVAVSSSDDDGSDSD